MYHLKCSTLHASPPLRFHTLPSAPLSLSSTSTGTKHSKTESYFRAFACVNLSPGDELPSHVLGATLYCSVFYTKVTFSESLPHPTPHPDSLSLESPLLIVFMAPMRTWTYCPSSFPTCHSVQLSVSGT